MSDEPITVLAIEDDAADAALLARHVEAIRSSRIELICCESSIEGLTALTEHEVDVVLLDYMLGADTGITTLHAIRKSGYDCPVVFLTGRGDEQVAIDVFQAGASDYLPKASLSPASLQRTISNAVDKARLQKLIERHQEQLERKASDLARRNREIGAFYHTVSHELKTPLTSIHAFLSILLDGLAGEVTDQQREYLSIAKESADQMGRCIDDLVDATRLETGKLSLERQACELAPLAEKVLAAARARSQERGIELVEELPDDLPPVHADGARIAQVVRNLVSNALKFTPSGGRIVVRAEEDGSGAVRVSVTDTGRGIPATHLERIFDRLHQVQDDDCATAGGLGLGLHICKEIVVLHGGHIAVESVVDAGSTFTFTIPVHVESPEPVPAQEAA